MTRKRGRTVKDVDRDLREIESELQRAIDELRREVEELKKQRSYPFVPQVPMPPEPTDDTPNPWRRPMPNIPWCPPQGPWYERYKAFEITCADPNLNAQN